MTPDTFHIGQKVSVLTTFNRDGVIFNPGACGVIVDMKPKEVEVDWEHHHIDHYQYTWWVWKTAIEKNTYPWKKRLSE